jgi:hypothetical protein
MNVESQLTIQILTFVFHSLKTVVLQYFAKILVNSMLRPIFADQKFSRKAQQVSRLFETASRV